MSEKKVSPFSNGSEYIVYRDDNCDICKFGFDESTGVGSCKYERALDVAYLSDGFVKAEYLSVLGLDKGGSRKCSLFRSYDGVLRPGTVEYDQQRTKDLEMLTKWSREESER